MDLFEYASLIMAPYILFGFIIITPAVILGSIQLLLKFLNEINQSTIKNKACEEILHHLLKILNILENTIFSDKSYEYSKYLFWLAVGFTELMIINLYEEDLLSKSFAFLLVCIASIIWWIKVIR